MNSLRKSCTISLLALLSNSERFAVCSQTNSERSIETGTLPTEVELDGPLYLAMSRSDVLYVSDQQGEIFKIDLRKNILSRLFSKQDFAAGPIYLTSEGTLLVGEYAQCRILSIDLSSGLVKPFAGGVARGDNQSCKTSGDGEPASKASFLPGFLTMDRENNLLIADVENRRIRRIDAKSGLIATVAGSDKPDSTGDGGPAISAGLHFPYSVAVNLIGDLFIGQAGNGPSIQAIRKVDARTGLISSLRGSEFRGIRSLWSELPEPRVLFSDSVGNLYVLSKASIHYVDFANHAISIVAGTREGFSGDGGHAINAQLSHPYAMAFDSESNIYIADTGNNRVRKIDATTRVITTVAGNGKGPKLQSSSSQLRIAR